MSLITIINQINSIETIKPEDKSMFIVGNWLATHNFEVYFDKKKDITSLEQNYPDIKWQFDTFNSIGTLKKPDIIFQSEQDIYVLELKHAQSSKNTRELHDILFYYQLCSTKKDPDNGKEAFYLIHGERIDPSHILAASGFSPFGRIHERDGLTLVNPINKFFRIVGSENNLKGKSDLVRMGFLPAQEFIRCYDLCRYLWSFMTFNQISVPGYNLGVLLSDVLMEETPQKVIEKQIGKPAAFYQRYKETGKGGNTHFEIIHPPII